MSADDIVVGRWGTQFLGRRFQSSIGKGGLAEAKREGDGATPLGTHHIVEMYFRADRMTAPTDWATPIGPQDLWSDDMSQPDYNNAVKVPYPFSHERLARADPLYDLVLVTDWNFPNAVPGKGSAIFVHQWRKPRHPTEGCIAFSRTDLRWIAKRISPGTKLVVRD